MLITLTTAYAGIAYGVTPTPNIDPTFSTEPGFQSYTNDDKEPSPNAVAETVFPQGQQQQQSTTVVAHCSPVPLRQQHKQTDWPSVETAVADEIRRIFQPM